YLKQQANIGETVTMDIARQVLDSVRIMHRMCYSHLDIKPENILVSSDQISGIVDFDNGYFGDLLHDVTTTICWFCFKDNKLDLRFVESFVSSYQKERELSEIEKQYLGQSIKFRLLRESIIWPMYVSHNIPIAKKFSDYFLTLYNNYNISETELRRRVN
ncbi:MAG: phosphotransferase, partial [Candidatus Scalindua sp.]|nr:phosphotransferase [Candidatus Scalindua sp.]